ncbi:MAG TPA: ferritin-like domain-containing protein [Gammaproteobacteria bacterium]
MADASAELHEPATKLTSQTIDRHRAIASLMEELEAVDWYDQRIDAAADDELRAILRHNRDEEKEHAAMVLEWLRRRDAALDEHLSTYLFSSRPILELEESADNAGSSVEGEGSLGVGSLKEGPVDE